MRGLLLSTLDKNKPLDSLDMRPTISEEKPWPRSHLQNRTVLEDEQ
jgi:hypothetical protein